MHLQVCRSHGEISHALEVWKGFQGTGGASPEQQYLACGGNKRTLNSFFAAPSNSQSAAASSAAGASGSVGQKAADGSAKVSQVRNRLHAILQPETGTRHSTANKGQKAAVQDAAVVGPSQIGTHQQVGGAQGSLAWQRDGSGGGGNEAKRFKLDKGESLSKVRTCLPWLSSSSIYESERQRWLK